MESSKTCHDNQRGHIPCRIHAFYCTRSRVIFPSRSLGLCHPLVFVMWCLITYRLLDFAPWPRLLQLESPCTFFSAHSDGKVSTPFIDCVSLGGLVDWPRAASQRVCSSFMCPSMNHSNDGPAACTPWYCTSPTLLVTAPSRNGCRHAHAHAFYT